MAEQQKEHAQEGQAQEVQEEKGLLDQIIEQGRMIRDESQKGWARDVLSEFVKQIMEGTITVSKDTERLINARIARIDKLIFMQIKEIIHHPDFQKLEASW